ncbi:MAG: rane protein insertion efficiency factor YidD [Actinomycetota bacterium]
MKFLETIWLLPRNAFILFILGWRKAISPLYGDVCRYYPTCSAYGLGQVQQRGLVLGSLLTAWRILRCNPFSQGGVEHVKPGSGHFQVAPNGLVVSRVGVNKDVHQH